MSEYDAIECPIGGCGEHLYMTLMFSTPVLEAFTTAELADPASCSTQTWEVGCCGGHVLVLPADTAQDDYVFGRDPEHLDQTRLASATGWKWHA